MVWLVHGCYVFIRTISFVASHIAWIYAMLTGCAYFRLWKSYDIFWLWIYVIVTCAVPRLRYDNLILQCAFLWRRRCSDGERCRYALQEQDRQFDEEDEKSSKYTNAVDLAVMILRFRCSVAMMIGNIHVRLNAPELAHGPKLDPDDFSLHLNFVEWMGFQLSVYIDIVLLWAMLLFMVCRQCYLCCQLGCWKYYLWCVLVVVIGGALMEVPMQYTQKRFDQTWCQLRWKLDDDSREVEFAGPFNMTTVTSLVYTDH